MLAGVAGVEVDDLAFHFQLSLEVSVAATVGADDGISVIHLTSFWNN